MFHAYYAAQTGNRFAARLPLLFACNVFVGGALLLGWIYSIWQVHLLEPARRDLVLVAPPMLAGGELAAPPVHKPATRRAATALASQAVRKPAVHVQPPSSALAKNDRPSVEVAQPTDDTRRYHEADAGSSEGDGSGSGNGAGRGPGDGTRDGTDGAADPLPPASSAMPPALVAPTALEQLRIAGEKHIVPSDLTRTEIQRAGRTVLRGSFRVCIATSGQIARVDLLHSTGFADYDAKIRSTIEAGWRYRPFVINAVAVPACTVVTFVYSQS